MISCVEACKGYVKVCKRGRRTGIRMCNSGREIVRHRGLTAHVRARYRCFLPDLAGLAGVRRVRPMPDLNHSSILTPHRSAPRIEAVCIKATYSDSTECGSPRKSDLNITPLDLSPFPSCSL